MRALEVLTGFATAPGATFTAVTVASGNSLTVRSGPIDSKISLLTAWSQQQAAGNVRIRSPRLHDNVQGIRLFSPADEIYPLVPVGYTQSLISQDTLTVEITGSAVAGQIETACLLVAYEDLPGVAGRFIDTAELSSRLKSIVTVENTLTMGITGGYSGERAINSQFDLLKANTDYALMGYLVSASVAVVRWRGVDTGNLGVGGPGHSRNKFLTSRWFVDMSDALGAPWIPVFNSANRAGILIDAATNQVVVSPVVTSIFGELGEAGAAPTM